jgi:leucyl aminopeptidase
MGSGPAAGLELTVEVCLTEGLAAEVGAVGRFVAAGHVDGEPLAVYLAGAGFTGGTGETVTLPGPDGGPAQILAGTGAAWPAGPAGLRAAAGCLARAAAGWRRVAMHVPAALPAGVPPGAAARAVTEGFVLGGYRFTRYQAAAAAAPGPQRLDLLLPGHPDLAGPVAAAHRAARAVAMARDLGNEPGGILTPAEFASRAETVAAACGLGCEVWDTERITVERLGGLLGVSRGSAQPPRLVKLEYRPDNPGARIAFVGKGVTFDSGGLNLKQSRMMLPMKTDMAGAAAVLAAMSALRDLACPVAVTGWLPLTDNMVGGDATRPGDVLRIRDGTTVEVRSTDAEGRLILADALVLAGEAGPDAIVDVATLTDAVSLAAGRRFAGLAGNHDGLAGQVQAAAELAGEAVWRLPPPGRARRSAIADLANAGDRYGQSVAAAAFLGEFVPAGTPWAHLDIAGPAVSEEDDGEWTAGATGVMVRTLIEFAAGYQSLPPG